MSALGIYLLSLLDGARGLLLAAGLLGSTLLIFLGALMAMDDLPDRLKGPTNRLLTGTILVWVLLWLTPSLETVLAMKAVPYVTTGQRGEMNAKTLDDLMEVVSLWAKEQKEKQK